VAVHYLVTEKLQLEAQQDDRYMPPGMAILLPD